MTTEELMEKLRHTNEDASVYVTFDGDHASVVKAVEIRDCKDAGKCVVLSV